MTDAPDSEGFEQLERLFHHARSLQGAARRQFLESMDDDVAHLRAELEELLRADSSQGSLFDTGGPYRAGWGDAAELIGSVSPGDSVGEFTVRKLIGTGGMGRVFAATQDRPKRTVALKVLHRGAVSRLALRRFEFESDILGTLAHPGIAQVFGAGLHRAADGVVPYLAMERIEGKNITRYADDRGLTLESKLELIAVVAEAVEHAHRKGIIHRDLKPSNILVDESGRPRILDFGVARATDPELRCQTIETQAGDIVGTLAYMSPEQASGDPREVDTRSDVYALGVLLFELVAGRRPHDLAGSALHDALRRIREHEAPALGTLVPGVSVDVATIAGKALAKEKARRYPSASALAEDLRRFLKDEPITARAASRAYHCRKFIQRNKLLVTAATAVVLALLAGVTGTSIGLGEARREAVRARDESERARIAARQYRGIVDFFNEALGAQDLLRFGKPVGTLRDFVDTIAAEVGTRFADDPEAEIITRQTIGRAYVILQRFEEAEAQLVAALHLAQHRWGVGDGRTAETLMALGGLNRLRRRFDESRTRLEQALAILETESAGVAARFSCEKELAWLEYDLGRSDRARQYVERARAVLPGEVPLTERWFLEILDAQLARHAMDLERADMILSRLVDDIATRRGPDHPMRGIALLERGGVAVSEERWSDAETLAREGMGIFRSAARGGKTFLHANQDVLAHALFEQGKIEEAEASVREILSRQEAAKTDALRQAPVRILLGRILARRGRGVEALEVFEDLVARIDRAVPDGSSAVAQQLSSIAIRLMAVNEPSRAETLARRAVELDRERSSPDRLVSSMNILVNALRAQRKVDEVEPLQAEQVRLAIATLGADHTATLLYRAAHGSILIAQGHYEEAVRELRAVEVLESRDLEDHHRRMLIDLSLQYSVALTELDDFAPAEARLLKTYEMSLAQDGPTHGRTLFIIRRLRTLYHRFGEEEKLDALRQRLRGDRE